MAVSRLHNSTKATDAAKLLLLNKRRVKHLVSQCITWPHISITTTLT